jgi:hypothetical protein
MLMPDSHKITCTTARGHTVTCKNCVVLAPANITIHPRPAVVWSDDVSSVQLACRATNVDPLKPVVWVRDNGGDVMYVNNGAPRAGFNLGLHSVRTRLFNVEYVQGYYRCEVWDADGTRSRRLTSQSALVTMRGWSFVLMFEGALVSPLSFPGY